MNHPYTVTPGGLASTLRQLRSNFPNEVTADTLKKWSIAPNNETYIVNVLKFLGIIDEDGKRSGERAKVFLEHEDEGFARGFAEITANAYADLFETFGDNAWYLEKDRLISYFRSADETSATVGKRQASTFQLLAAFAGHGDAPSERAHPRRTQVPKKKAKTTTKEKGNRPLPPASASSGGARSLELSTGFALRIEVNLPVTDDQAVYDKIFRSIRENLLYGKSF